MEEHTTLKPGECGETGTAGRKDGNRDRGYNLSGVPPAAERPSASPDDIYLVGGTLARRSFSDATVLPRLRASGVILRLEYYDPENWGETEPVITVDTASDPMEVYLGDCPVQTNVTLRMHADIAHRFWMKKTNLIVSITRRQIVAKGPVSLVMKLLPALKPCFTMYREILKELGRDDLLNYPDPVEGNAGAAGVSADKDVDNVPKLQDKAANGA